VVKLLTFHFDSLSIAIDIGRMIHLKEIIANLALEQCVPEPHEREECQRKNQSWIIGKTDREL